MIKQDQSNMQIPVTLPINGRGRVNELPVYGRLRKLVTIASVDLVRHTIDRFTNHDLRYITTGENVTVVPIMVGSYEFGKDLIDTITEAQSLAVEPVRVRTVGRTESGMPIRNVDLVDPALIENRTVIVVDDMLKSGSTARLVVDTLEPLRPKKIITVFLCRKMIEDPLIKPDYVLFNVHPTVWAVGKGLDYKSQLRNLKGIFDLNVQNYDAAGNRIASNKFVDEESQLVQR